MESVLVAAMSLAGTLAGAYLAHRRSAALLAYRLAQLEAKVNRHNRLIERTYALEETTALLNERLNGINHRIARLESPHNMEQG